VIDTVQTDRKRPVATRTRHRSRELSTLSNIKFQEIRSKYPNISLKDAKEWAGFSPRSHAVPAVIDAELALSIEKQRDAAVKATGYSIEYALRTLVDCSHKRENATDRIRAVHEANSMLPGYLAPERKEISTRGVFLELSNLSNTDIGDMIELLKSDDHVS
jgi:hypothetical protein